MENMDNNLEDFFKNQLNRFDEPNEDWAKPDPSDWEKVASQVPMFNKPPFWTLSNLSIIGLSTVLVCSIFYIWHLKTEVSTLEENIQIQDINIERVQKEIKIIDEKYIKQQAIIEEENEDLKQEYQNITQQNLSLQNITKKQQKAISEIYKIQNNPTSKTLKENDKSTSENRQSSNKKTNKDNVTPLKANSKSKLSDNKTQPPIAEHQPSTKGKTAKTNVVKDEIKNIYSLEMLPLTDVEMNKVTQNMRLPKENISVDDNKNKRKKFNIRLPKVSISNIQLGYEYRLQEMYIPSKIDIVELESFSDEHNGNGNYIGLHGLTLNVPLSKNWSIETGARFSNSQLEYSSYSEAIYNTENEYTLTNGTIGKTINIEQETPFSTTKTEVQLLFDADKKLADNEDFSWFSDGYQELKTFQIPLGISYQYKKKKLKGLLGAGLQWNKIAFGDIDYKMSFFNQDYEFRALTSPSEVTSDIKRLNYFSAYSMLGLEYQILKDWSIRATGTYNFHLNKTTSDLWNNSGKTVSLGFQYQF